MPSETPPRHSKKNNEPETIELEAERVDVDANQDAPEASADLQDAPSDATDATDAVEATGEEAADDIATQADAEPMENTDEAKEPEAAAAEKPKPEKSAGKSGAIAAGILGGLIAMAGVGGAQYAGFIPNLGPVKTVTDYGPDITALKAKIDELANAQAAIPKVDLSPVKTSLSTVETRLGTVEKQISDLPENASPTVIPALKGALANAKETLAKQDTQISALAAELADLKEKFDRPQDDVKVALAIAAASLKTAIDRGGPFLNELNTMASVIPDDPAVIELRKYAATGVLSRADMTRAFPPTADAMIAALHPEKAGESIADRLLSSAMSVIKVRPVGNVEGTSPESIIARIEEKLQNGDFKGAAIEWKTLPDAAKTAGAGFKKKLDDRIRVETIVATAMSGSVGGKGKQG